VLLSVPPQYNWQRWVEHEGRGAGKGISFAADNKALIGEQA
jgi:hypothetical protein